MTVILLRVSVGAACRRLVAVDRPDSLCQALSQSPERVSESGSTAGEPAGHNRAGMTVTTDAKSAKALRERLTPLIRKTQPYSKRITHRGIWVEPNLLAEIEYRAKSAEGKVRPRFSEVSGRTCDGEGRFRSVVGVGWETTR